jgi:hypothetical protein
MWWNALIAPVASLFGKALDVVDKYVPDKDLAEKLKSELNGKILEIANGEFLALIKAQSEIIIAEAKGESWLQRNWRPVLMSIFGAIVANNYIVAPYVGLLFGHQYAAVLDVPPDMWDLLKLGLGGYIVGRSAEKIAGGDGLKSVAKKIIGGS